MSQKMQGFYQAEVLDTSMFSEEGRIKVHIMGAPNLDVFEMVYVMTPFGGLPNMGMQALPPIGAVGLITYINQRDNLPVWVGSLMRYWETDDEPVLSEGYANPVEAGDPSDFVLKTQYTTIEDQDIDGENKVENVFKMNEESITFSKMHQNDNYKYEKEAYDPNDEYPANTITITDGEIKLKVRTEDNSADRLLIIDSSTLKLEWAEDQSLIMTEDKTIIRNGEADVTVYNNGKVEVNAEKIELNGTDGTGMFYEGFREFVNNAFNSHTHGTPSGPSSPPTSPYTSTSTAKSGHVKLS